MADSPIDKLNRKDGGAQKSKDYTLKPGGVDYNKRVAKPMTEAEKKAAGDRYEASMRGQSKAMKISDLQKRVAERKARLKKYNDTPYSDKGKKDTVQAQIQRTTAAIMKEQNIPWRGGTKIAYGPGRKADPRTLKDYDRVTAEMEAARKETRKRVISGSEGGSKAAGDVNKKYYKKGGK